MTEEQREDAKRLFGACYGQAESKEERGRIFDLAMVCGFGAQTKFDPDKWEEIVIKFY